MRKVDTSAGTLKMRNALRTLRVRWEATRAEWHDVASENFEQNHLAPLEPRVLAAIQSMATMVMTLSRAQQECE